MSIIKCRTTSGRDWIIKHKSFASGNNVMFLNGTGQVAANNGGHQSHGASTVTMNTGTSNLVGINNSGDDYVMYCFAEIKGFSKAFSYNGNASTDGPFIYTGFKPAMVFIVATGSSGYQRFIWDNKRDTYNVAQNPLAAQDTGAEPASASGYREIDFLSNGIKIRASLDQLNTNGAGYMGFAFAEAPLVGTNNIPATAR
jgi:hypothetical protein